MASNPAPISISELDRDKVREQLSRIVKTHHFNNSRRYPALLRFIVEETLEGRGEFLKERLLGVRVFDRPADYDTATDPIVRVTIAEIRKRIAQYYHDEEHDAEIRIELLPGRYAPEFRRRRDGSTERVSVSPAAVVPDERSSGDSIVPLAEEEALNPALQPVRQTSSHRAWLSWGLAGLLVLSVSASFALRWITPTAQEQFWGQVLTSPHTVLVCLPTDLARKVVFAGRASQMTGNAISSPQAASISGNREASQPTFLDHESLGENVVYSDMLATLNIANVLAVHHRDYHVKLTAATTLEDVRVGPSILVGGLDNQWAMRALMPLRYHFAGSDADRYWIADGENPSDKRWSLDLKQTYVAVTRDYALIARLHNEQTGQVQIVVAGIGMSGTAAAGEFITDEHRLEELRRRVGKGFKDLDFEVVLSTDVVNGIADSPKILAVSIL